MLTLLRQTRPSALNRISEGPSVSPLFSLTANNQISSRLSSYSPLSQAQDLFLLAPRSSHAIFTPWTANSQRFTFLSIYSPTVKASFSSEAENASSSPTGIVVDLYQEILHSVEKTRTMPPNAKLWSLVENCINPDDIKLLFQTLQKLRIFRLSNLRIHANFNDHLCMRISEACARASAPEYGLKALWKHNVYGLTPSIGSAHYLLLHAKGRNDVSLMVKIMYAIKKSSLPLQPGTADIVFSICSNSNDWDLITKYSRRFLKAGVKLHRTAFDIWMEFAAKRGDAKSIWKIEKLRSKAVKKHTLASGFSCAKGCLIERKPDSAAAIISLLYQDLPDQRKALIAQELQNSLVEWSKKLVKRQKKEEREALAEALKSDIIAMAAALGDAGINANLKVEGELTC